MVGYVLRRRCVKMRPQLVIVGSDHTGEQGEPGGVARLPPSAEDRS